MDAHAAPDGGDAVSGGYATRPADTTAVNLTATGWQLLREAVDAYCRDRMTRGAFVARCETIQREHAAP